MHAGDACYTFRDPTRLPPISASQIQSGLASGVFVAPPGTPRHFYRPTAAFLDDPDGARLFPGIPTWIITEPPPFTLSLRDVTLIGTRTLLTRDLLFTHDQSFYDRRARRKFLARLALPNSFDNEHTGLVPTSTTDRFRLPPANRPLHRMDGTVVLLCSAEPTNYGSFLFRVLPKLIGLRPNVARHRFMLWSNPADTWHRAFLNLLGVPDANILHHDPNERYDIAHAIMPSQRNPGAFLDTETSAFYAQIRADFGTPRTPRRIYVSRQAYNRLPAVTRVLLNEAELIERLRAKGFDIVEPERLTPAQQIAVFSSADLVVGPAGSGMFNTVFCHPGARVIDIESEPHWVYTHANLFASLGLRYGIFEGVADSGSTLPSHKPWRVNIEALLRFIGDTNVKVW